MMPSGGFKYHCICSGTAESGCFPPCLFKRGATGVLFHNNVIGIFMVYEGRLETDLLQLCWEYSANQVLCLLLHLAVRYTPETLIHT